MKYAYFPGCSLESTAWDFDLSTRAVCRRLGIELEEIPNWVCCGSTPAHSSNASLAVALPVLNLQKARTLGHPVMTACASCYARVRTANHLVRNELDERQRAERVTGKPYDGAVEVLHVLDVLVNRFGLEGIRQQIERPLTGLRVACYYGCLLTRPPEVVAFDNAENPTCMDDLAAAAGADPVTWPYKTECCGASLSITQSKVVGRLGRKLLLMARQAGARCIVVACPLCQLNLDLRQSDAAGLGDDIPPTPVLYITQLLGLALGISAKELGLEALTVSADSLFDGSPLPPEGVRAYGTGSGCDTVLACNKGGAS